MNRDPGARLEALRTLLETGELSTQEELRAKLEKLDFAVTQSTISRDLKKLAAVRAFDSTGQAVYQLPATVEPKAAGGGLADLVVSVRTNGSMIVMHTVVGSASLIARHLDNLASEEILGTIAGDDTVFIAPSSTGARQVAATIKFIDEALR